MKVAVVGFSVAGIAAALRVRRAAHHAVILPYHPDSASIANIYELTPGVGGRPSMSGEEYEAAALDELASMGVEFADLDSHPILFCDSVSTDAAGRICLLDSTEHQQEAFDRLVFAPNGSQPQRRVGDYDLTQLVGRGISFSAAADASLIAGKTVLVVGNGVYAADQVAILLRAGCVVTLVRDADAPKTSDMRLSNGERLSSTIRVVDSDAVGDPVFDAESGRIRGLSLVLNGSSVFEPCDVLFLASDPEVSWDLFTTERQARQLESQGLLATAGLASGVPYGHHHGLWSDGEKVADRVLI
jgi:thioredoxin reductase